MLLEVDSLLKLSREAVDEVVLRLLRDHCLNQDFAGQLVRDELAFGHDLLHASSLGCALRDLGTEEIAR